MDTTFYKQSALCIAAALGVVLASPAFAQSASTAPAADAFALEEIVVTARRKDESLQDVPTVINAVSGAEIQKLNIRKFEDIASVVPGLVMTTTTSGTTASASVRGVNYEVNASGNNGTIEFYQNDAPISAGNLFQTVYDVQQVELLRGPQGTLRGRASPSGSMTVTTRRPDLQDIGGYVSGSGNNIGGYNGQGAFNFPIISNVLAVRVAGAYDKNEGNRVRSINNPLDPSSKTKSGRATVRFEPTDSLSFILTAQKTKQESKTFDLMESQQNVYPNNAVINQAGATPPPFGAATTVPPFLSAGQRLTVTDVPRSVDLDFSNYNLQAQWAFAGQKLNYVGARNEQHLVSFAPSDLGDYFGPLAPATYQGYGQPTDTHSYSTAHELRISNEERIAGMFDYIFGVFTQRTHVPTSLVSPTAVVGAGAPGPGQFINLTYIKREGGTKEQSAFGNLTAHIGDALEVSAGARYIKYEATGDLLQRNSSGVYVANPLAHEAPEFHATIYSGSVKYNFTDDFMAYVSTGTSWRPGIKAVGDFSLNYSAKELSFLNLPPEKSTSYEIGLKSTMLDKRVRTNASFFHQKFTNYPYRSPGGVWYIQDTIGGQGEALSAALFNFVAAVPVEVNGVEASVDFSATPNWDMGLSAAVSKGEIKSGVIPCTDVDNDGVPDAPRPIGATLAQLQAIYGVGTILGAQPQQSPGTQGALGTISGCTVSQRSATAPQWSSVLQSEYRLPINSALSSFVRGQASIYGNSKNDPLNPVDDVERYALLNLYLGLRDPDGTWEVSVYGKNVTNTERVLSRAGSVALTRVNSPLVPTNYIGSDNTGGMTLTAPREFGVSLRYAFGSK